MISLAKAVPLGKAFCLHCKFLGEDCKPFCLYFGKRKQVTKVTYLVKEQNVSVISTDVNGIS